MKRYDNLEYKITQLERRVKMAKYDRRDAYGAISAVIGAIVSFASPFISHYHIFILFCTGVVVGSLLSIMYHYLVYSIKTKLLVEEIDTINRLTKNKTPVRLRLNRTLKKWTLYSNFLPVDLSHIGIEDNDIKNMKYQQTCDLILEKLAVKFSPETVVVDNYVGQMDIYFVNPEDMLFFEMMIK